MSTKYKVKDQEKLHFITTTVIGWVDIFARPSLKHVIIDSLDYCQKIKD
jgi:putative transposase